MIKSKHRRPIYYGKKRETTHPQSLDDGRKEEYYQHNVFLDNKAKYNRRLGRYINYRELQELLFSFFPELRTAYELKEYYIRLNRTCTLAEAPDALDTAITAFENSGIEEFCPFYTLLTNWRVEIINSFTIIGGIRINNSFIESKNRLLEKLLYNGNGFSNFQRTRNRILYCLNPNDTYRF